MAGAAIIFIFFVWQLEAFAGEGAGLPEAPSSIHLTDVAFMIALTLAVEGVKSVPPIHTRVVDRQFMLLSAFSTATIFADSYTTTWIGENYRARHYGACTVEGGEPRLYGLHPTVARSYAVAASMSSGAIALSYLAKRTLPSKIKRLWSAPLFYESSASVDGFTTNIFRCN